MCGMGEASSLMMEMKSDSLQIEAVDFSSEMTKRCQENAARFPSGIITIHTQNVFELAANARFDRICCSFGLKTFDDSQLRQFAILIQSLLKPRGRAAFIEIYVPRNPIVRLPYLFYIRHIIPLIGLLCLGNPDCYRSLAIYTEDHAQRDFFGSYLKETGLMVQEQQLFFGCAKLYLAQQLST
jgi:demethylmenaquinone methyltransferase/2-methoxy-6-polyprenyl-1,4-benzoquinol methylase